ncbi:MULTISPECIES: phosphatase PAP2 family protein [Paracoccaceae]|uniref:Phosphatase PAP2 family protein n=1 Tax=Paracoccus shanxieyensis TaxID=2675752 RepID=A0A6L6J405_9RHOB|nr:MULTISPECIES: phosphatase PAP2 family protein [Paracoccaceae]MTH66132.1 phosphatase PAP2 family protein [Paracoccus shanxieyensis]MTH89355.1 phosphatase PAP2 family protein [Paracoccus shanxieyensis]QBJ26489.1 phosphatase PAP2 family protein [Haematobacter massiliensis]
MSSSNDTGHRRALEFLKATGIDKAVAAVVAVGSLLLFGFIKIADEVVEGETRTFDEAILMALRTPGDITQPIGPPWLHEMVRDFTALGSTGVLAVITFGVASWLLFSKRAKTAGLVVASVVGGVAFSNLLKWSFARPRPDLVPHSVAVFTNSFPSGHAMMSAVVYLTLGILIARTQQTLALKIYVLALAVFLTALVGMSRVYLGVHWPSDVLAGWAVGACWALFCSFILSGLQETGKVEPESKAG